MTKRGRPAKTKKTVKSDQDAIQGLWRVVSYVSEGQSVMGGPTHYQFEGNRIKVITPGLVDDGSSATFELDSKARPKRITTTYKVKLRGEKRAVTRANREAYDLNGDTLRLCFPNVWGEYPDVISSRKHSVVTLKRDHGPPPATKQVANKKPIKDATLGKLTWDDNLDQWDARVRLKTGLRVDCHIDPGDRSDADAIAALREFVRWCRASEAAARRFAADELLDTYNDNWNDEKAISARTFASRIRLEAISLSDDDSAELYYHDGDLFCGHCIIVSVNAKHKFTDATIAG